MGGCRPAEPTAGRSPAAARVPSRRADSRNPEDRCVELSPGRVPERQSGGLRPARPGSFPRRARPGGRAALGRDRAAYTRALPGGAGPPRTGRAARPGLPRPASAPGHCPARAREALASRTRFRKALELDPALWEVHRYLGLLTRAAGDRIEARLLPAGPASPATPGGAAHQGGDLRSSAPTEPKPGASASRTRAWRASGCTACSSTRSRTPPPCWKRTEAGAGRSKPGFRRTGRP